MRSERAWVLSNSPPTDACGGLRCVFSIPQTSRQHVARKKSSSKRSGYGFAALRHQAIDLPDYDEETDVRPTRRKRDVPADAGRVATDLLMARMFDERPELLAQIRNGAPTVLIDVADARTLDRVWHAWREVLFDDGQRIDVAHEGFKRSGTATSFT